MQTIPTVRPIAHLVNLSVIKRANTVRSNVNAVLGNAVLLIGTEGSPVLAKLIKDFTRNGTAKLMRMSNMFDPIAFDMAISANPMNKK